MADPTLTWRAAGGWAAGHAAWAAVLVTAAGPGLPGWLHFPAAAAIVILLLVSGQRMSRYRARADQLHDTSVTLVRLLWDAYGDRLRADALDWVPDDVLARADLKGGRSGHDADTEPWRPS